MAFQGYQIWQKAQNPAQGRSGHWPTVELGKGLTTWQEVAWDGKKWSRWKSCSMCLHKRWKKGDCGLRQRMRWRKLFPICIFPTHLIFSDPSDFFQPTWFFFRPTCLPTTSPLGQLAKPTSQVKEVTPYPQLLNKCKLFMYMSGVLSLLEFVPSKQWRREVQLQREGFANYCEEN